VVTGGGAARVTGTEQGSHLDIAKRQDIPIFGARSAVTGGTECGLFSIDRVGLPAGFELLKSCPSPETERWLTPKRADAT
jgi:hypothetical protein